MFYAMMGLTKLYGDTAVVKRLNLEVLSQQITAFLGRNGARKSTTIKMLLGITECQEQSGELLRNPHNTRDESVRISYIIAFHSERNDPRKS